MRRPRGDENALDLRWCSTMSCNKMLTELSPSCFFTLGANETCARVPLSFFVVAFEGPLIICMWFKWRFDKRVFLNEFIECVFLCFVF